MTPVQHSTRSRHDWLGTAACVAVAMWILALSWFKVSSLDTGYHIAYGRHFWNTREIVGHDPDPFLYPETAVPFVNANWGSQVIMASVDLAAGAGGLIALRLTMISIIFTSIALLIRRQGIGWSGLAWAWLLAALAAYERFSMRPELFSYAAMCGLLLLLVRGVRTRRSVAGLIALQLAWVNLHSYFIVGPMMTGAWLVGGLLRGTRSAGQADKSNRQMRLLAVGLALQVAVCIINPWHVRGAVFPIATLQFLQGADAMGGATGDPSTSAWSEISEFQSPFSFHGQIINARTIRGYYLLLAVAALGIIAALIRGRPGPAMVMLLFLLMSTQMRRNIAQFALVGAPLATCAIAGLPWLMRRNLLRRYARPTLSAAAIGLACWWTWGIVGGEFYYAERRITREFGTGYSDRTFQRKAALWMAAQENLQPRLYVDYFSSSNALPWLPVGARLFVNTNTFTYRDETLNTAFKLGLGQIDHNRFFKQFGVNVVLLHCGPDTQTLVGRMAADDGTWALVYFDQHSVVFVRRLVAHVPVILENELSEKDLDAPGWIASSPGPDRYKALNLGTSVNVPMSLGWFRSAATLLREVVAIAPDHHESWINLGMCHAQMGNRKMRSRELEDAVAEFEAARSCLRKALELDPANAVARHNLERVEATFSASR